MSYSVWVCPKCAEQLDAGCYEEVEEHVHDGVTYHGVEVAVALDVGPMSRALREQAQRDEDVHWEVGVKRAADAAELAAMEMEWRRSAPAEQVEAYEVKNAPRLTSVLASAILKEQWGKLGDTSTSVGLAWHGPSPLLASEEQVAEHRAKVQALRRKELEDTLALFESEGPARVPFWKLRDTRRELAELDAETAS